MYTLVPARDAQARSLPTVAAPISTWGCAGAPSGRAPPTAARDAGLGAVRLGTRGAPERLHTAAAASACEAAVGRRQPPRTASVSRGARAHGGAPRRVPPRHGRRRVRRPLPGVATRTAAATRQGGGHSARTCSMSCGRSVAAAASTPCRPRGRARRPHPARCPPTRRVDEGAAAADVPTGRATARASAAATAGGRRGGARRSQQARRPPPPLLTTLLVAWCTSPYGRARAGGGRLGVAGAAASAAAVGRRPPRAGCGRGVGARCAASPAPRARPTGRRRRGPFGFHQTSAPRCSISSIRARAKSHRVRYRTAYTIPRRCPLGAEAALVNLPTSPTARRRRVDARAPDSGSDRLIRAHPPPSRCERRAARRAAKPPRRAPWRRRGRPAAPASPPAPPLSEGRRAPPPTLARPPPSAKGVSRRRRGAPP